MTAVALALVLLQAAAATPTPVPTPTPRPATAGPRTLQDFARERKLAGASKGKATLGTVSGSSSASSTPAATPEPGAEHAVAPTPAPQAASSASVRVTTVANDGVVDSTGGVRVNGTVRNGGSNPACNVVVTVRIMDSRGEYLASSQASPDTAVIPPGQVVSFRTIVQAPSGVRGARLTNDRKDVSEGSTTMEGGWRILGGTEATVASATEDCPP